MFSKCRACLRESDNMKVLSDDEPEGKLLISMFKSVNNFEWIIHEQIASNLCYECKPILELAHNFQKKCLESNEIITKYLQDLQEKNADQASEHELTETTNQEEKDTETLVAPVEKKGKTRTKEFSAEEVEEFIEKYKDKQQENRFACKLCPYILGSLRALSAHISQSHKEVKDNWCYLCNIRVDNLSEHNHEENVDKEKCPFCDRLIKKKYFLDHVRKHSNVKPFHCDLCSLGFIAKYHLDNHYNQVHSKDDKKNSNDTAASKTHCDDNIKDKDNNQRNYCEKCAKKVRSLPLHVEKYHGEAESQKFICDVCSKELKDEPGLRAHLRLHKDDTPFKCKYCKKPHKNRSQMLDHERIHTGEKPYICSVCSKGFTQAGALNTHMKIHTGRPEQCNICEKRFCRPSELRLHLRRHSGENPYLCNQCGRAFIQTSHLVEHMKTHSDKRPYVCTYCEKSFKQKSLLVTHLQIHAGSKSFQCKLCNYACFKSYRLKQHMKTHEKRYRTRTYYECPICGRTFWRYNSCRDHVTSTHNAILP